MIVSTEQVWQEMSQKLCSSFFRRRVADDQLAVDLLQETFMRIKNGKKSKANGSYGGQKGDHYE